MAEDRPSDAQLVERAREGESDAFGLLVERHQDYVYNSVFHLVGTEPVAEDLAQETFVRAFEHLDGFEGRARFTTWLYSIMLNCVRSHWRRANRARVLSTDREEGAPNPVSDADGPVESNVREERVRRVRAAIGELEPDHREIIVLRDIRGLTYEELARTLDLPAGTVKSRLYRARRQLKDKLAPYWATQQ